MPVLLRSTAPHHRRTRRAVTALIVAGTLLAGPLTTDAAPEPDIAPNPVEVHRLQCEATTVAGDELMTDAAVDALTYTAHAVRCTWTVPAAPNAVGVRLLRVVVGSGTPRQQIFATRDLSENSHLDAPVRPDHRYAYRVQAITRTGRVVSSSRTVTVAVPSVEIEPLRLECRTAASDAEARARIGCRWSLPTDPGARRVTLWRSVDGGARERVTSSRHPFASSYRDVVPAGTQRVVYAVIANDGAGDIVARSRAERVTIRSGSSDSTVERLDAAQIGRAG